jgi:tetratricopeptide (TPR) repeat protein
VVEVPTERAITVDGATSVWPPTTRGVGPGDPVWVFGLRAAADAGKPLVVHIGDNAFALAVRGADPARVTRAVARARIADLERQMELATGTERAAIAKQVETVALEHKLISSQTSLLVLENDYDEHRFLDAPSSNAPAPDAPNAPLIDPGSPTQGITIDQEYLKNIPVPGRKFDAVLGGAAGSRKDAVGASFSGSSSLENQYIVDGINTTGLTMGGSSCCAGAAVESPSEPTYAQPYVGVMRDVMQALARHDRGRALHLASKWELDSPGEVAAIIALGEALEARGAYALAARAYGSIIDLYPKRAELLRAAGERLDRVDGARAVAIDAYRRALRERPDQASTYRLLAYDLMRDDNPEALDVVFDGMKRTDRPSIREVFMNDSAVIASYLLVHAPAKRAYIQARVRTALPTRPSLQIVLSWETDANDVDLHVRDARGGHSFYGSPELLSGGRLLDDVTTGFGPEMFRVEAPTAFPYHLGVHYYARGPEGVGLGTVQVIRYDGAGGVSIDNRPFVIQNDQAMVDLGVVE